MDFDQFITVPRLARAGRRERMPINYPEGRGADVPVSANAASEINPSDRPDAADGLAGSSAGLSRAGRFYLRHEYAVVYAVAAVSYTLIGLHAKFLLNWIVGPLWPIVFIWIGPVLVRRITGWKDPLP